MRYISLSEMAMKEHCEDEELELCVELGEYAEVFECGIHVIVEKTDSFEVSEWDHELKLEEMEEYLHHHICLNIGCTISLGLTASKRISDHHYLKPLDYFMIPNWFSYCGEGSSLSFHIPPVFEGLVIWAVCSGGGHQEFKVILKNKRDGIPLFEATHARPYFRGRWLRLISRREMEMEKYCEDDELELHVILRSENSEVVRCGIHVIKTFPFRPSSYDQIPALDPDIYNHESFEGSEGDHDIDYYETPFEGSGSSDHEIENQESEVESDRTIPSPSYHLLHHPRHGSMRFSTMQQWKAFLIRAFSLWISMDMQKFSPHDLN
uniref:TMV resistance protein N-like n=1 Tax=Populus alba TaxID=43335 RepID=A0A4U5MW68_POPAL|nr:hypothetical protein D5086_0000297790 [Populus alba]